MKLTSVTLDVLVGETITSRAQASAFFLTISQKNERIEKKGKRLDVICGISLNCDVYSCVERVYFVCNAADEKRL